MYSEYPVNLYSNFDQNIVKFLASAGARVVPIPYDASYENLTYLFYNTNGLLFFGGDVPVYNDDPEQHSRTMTNNKCLLPFWLIWQSMPMTMVYIIRFGWFVQVGKS